MSTESSSTPAGRTARIVDHTGHVYLESDVPDGVDPWWTVKRDLVCMTRGQHGTAFAAARLPEGQLNHPSWLEYVTPDSPALISYDPEASVISMCPEAVERATMSDAQFWDHVTGAVVEGTVFAEIDEHDGLEVPFSAGTPCTECGATAACSYDSEGRPMIHLQAQEADA